MFLALLELMLCAELPEVRSADDIAWFRDRLRLDLSDDAASQNLLQNIELSLKTISTQLMDMIHIAVN
jgi:hypothetical protein